MLSIVDETPTMRNPSRPKLALWVEYSSADLDKQAITIASSALLPAGGPAAKRPISPPERPPVPPASFLALPAALADQRLVATERVQRFQSASSFAAISTSPA